MAEVVVVSQPATSVREWLFGLPLAASAGNAVTSVYEGSKNYNCVTQYALGTVESSIKFAASAVAPVVKSLDKPIQAVDSYAVGKLVLLEEKVPALKAQPEEVVSYLTETKDAVTGKLAEGRSTISTRFSESKNCLTSQLALSKEAVCSKLRSGADAVTNSHAGIAVSESRKALASHFAQGKEVLGSTIASGRDAVYTKIQGGAESIANTRAGCLLGSGIDRTLATTEDWVEYLLPEIENEKELYIESESKEEGVPIELPHAPQLRVDRPAQDVGRLERLYNLSRKAKIRAYYRSMQKLQVMQKNCKSSLEQLKQAIDLLKLAQAARDGMDKRYQAVTLALKDFEEQLKQILSRQSKSVKVEWPSKDDEDEEGVKVEWLDPKPQEGYIQSSLDYAKQLSEKVFHTFQSVTVVTDYLPSRLKDGATHGYQYAQELYSTLKPVRTPADLTASSLHQISSLLETQLGYVTQLGTYLASVLQAGKVTRSVKTDLEEPPDEDISGEDGDNESSDSEIEEPVTN